MLFFLGAKAEFINLFQGVSQGIAALYLIFNLAEDFTDLLFDGVRALGGLFETLEVWE